MRCRLVSLILPLLATGCSKPSGSQAVITTGSSHYPILATGPNRQTAITNVPPVYKFKPAPGIKLDVCRLYAPNDPSNTPPDMIQLVTAAGIYELSEARTSTNYILDSTTLRPLRGPPFPGFSAGDEGSFEIGRTMPETGTGAFHVWWVARFRVD